MKNYKEIDEVELKNLLDKYIDENFEEASKGFNKFIGKLSKYKKLKSDLTERFRVSLLQVFIMCISPKFKDPWEIFRNQFAERYKEEEQFCRMFDFYSNLYYERGREETIKCFFYDIFTTPAFKLIIPPFLCNFIKSIRPEYVCVYKKNEDGFKITVYKIVSEDEAKE